MGSAKSGRKGSALVPASEAASRLLERVNRCGLRRTAVELGWDAARLHRLISGEARPTLSEATAVAAKFRIHTRLWLEPVKAAS
jgi:hypothetical protein